MENNTIHLSASTDYMLLARAVNYTEGKPTMTTVGLLLSTLAIILHTRIKPSTNAQPLLRTIRETSDLMLAEDNRLPLGHRPHYTTPDMVNIVDVFNELLGKLDVKQITLDDSQLSGMTVPCNVRLACRLLDDAVPGVFKVI